MATQYSVAARTSQMSQLNTTIGINAQIIFYSGAVPANVGTAPTGVLLVQFAGNAAGFGTATSGVLTAAAVAGANAAAAGVAGYYRINTTTGVAQSQGTVFQTTPLTTSAATAANSNVLNFAATTGVVVGMTATGTGVPTGVVVIAVATTTVTLNTVSTPGIAGATTITFGGDMNLTNTNIAAAQACTFTSLTITASGA